MRTMRVSMVVVLALLTAIVPALAQAQVDGTPWSGGSVAERVAGWLEGLWRSVAGGSDCGLPVDEPADPQPNVQEGPPMEMTEGDPGTEGYSFPEYDPNG